ncbi:MAG TPA: NAD(P)/FAD-dependent oxidoreductase [Polyangiales bacterium]|jgi:cation diffusion facilitator CzcD-associated flavoprotein CzcO|nr:NAD(P)/FAD-dependent oxidoreductase [Polyangiales bacterium]
MDGNHEILVIGTGFAGIGMGVRLREMGITDFAILEQGDGVGGTWRDNHYPGAACDVQSLLYSFSFMQNPRWSRMYAEQREILDYLNQVTDAYGVRPHIKFGCQVVRAAWNDRRGSWKVELSDGRSFSCKVLIAGTGGLSRPALPEIRGQDTFQGDAFHTARWNHGLDLTGKTVAVIGTGASAIQVVPAIASKVGALKLFQRTPPWIMPKPDREIGAKEQKMFEALPFTLNMARSKIYWTLESRLLGFVAKPKLMELVKREALANLRAEIKDPVLRAKVTPNYAFGCKRVLLSNDYYAALQRENVEVVTDGIDRIDAHSVVTRDGVSRPVDAIVYATGFQVGDFSAAPFDIYGAGGRDLREEWKHGAEAYLGASIAGFPNFFVITGPNTGLGHTSMVVMIEAHIQYIASALQTMREQGVASVDVKRAVQDGFNRKLHAKLSQTIWATGGCKSWYQTSAGKIVALWPGSTYTFRKRTEHFDMSKYEVTRPTAPEFVPAETPVEAPEPTVSAV